MWYSFLFTNLQFAHFNHIYNYQRLDFQQKHQDTKQRLLKNRLSEKLTFSR